MSDVSCAQSGEIVQHTNEKKPAFVIAEIGSNWRTLDDCLLSIRLAAGCCADAVKFQLFNGDALYGPAYAAKVKEYTTGSAFGYLAGEPKDVPGALPIEWLPRLSSEANRHGIEFMCSAFSPELVDAVDPFVRRHKVASAEMTHVRLLSRINATGKPVIVSTGGHSKPDISAALRYLPAQKTTLLYCVPQYPAQFTDLRTIDLLRKTFHVPVGFSDHSLDVLEIVSRAVGKHGATVVEKHVNFTGLPSPDSGHSLSWGHFGIYVNAAKGRPWRDPEFAFMATEKDMVLRHNRRLIAMRDIQVGEMMSEGENFGIFRSLKNDDRAFSPFFVNAVHGLPAKRAILAGEGIGPGDV